RTADGWVMVMCMLEKFWQTFVEGIGNPAWAAEPRFANFAERRKVREELTVLVDAILGTQPTAHWTQLFAGRIPIAPVLDIAQALDNPYVRDVDMLQDVAHASGSQRLLRNPIKLDGQRLSGNACPPLNADADALLRELGYNDADRARLLGA
ncbi:MAG: CoA transferase, partial [Stenotrophomonas sp.]